MSNAPSAVFDPYGPAFAADPYAVYARLRDETPVFRSAALEMTLFARYDDIRALLLGGKVGRTLDHVSTPEEVARRRSAASTERLPNYDRYVRVNLLETEGEAHARVRRIVAAALDPRRIRTLRSQVQAVVNELLDKVRPRGYVEFVSEIAVPLPVHMISDLLGWPAEERHRLRPWSAHIVRLYEKDHTTADEERAETATTEFAAQIATLAELRSRAPRDDLISALVSIADEGERLTRDELIATCMLLLNAGHEATVNAMGNGLLALLSHPEQWERLRQSPSLLPTAIEEMIRYDAPLHLFHRFVLEDMEHSGFQFRRGEKIGLLYGSGNRDPGAFDNPDTFDIGRTPNRHLGFGAGNHFCLGAPLARLELEVLFGSLLERFPALRLEKTRPVYRPGLVFRGLEELRVRWD